LKQALLYATSGLTVIWGIAHIVPTGIATRAVEPLSPDNRRNLAMEWVAEGLTLIFLGILLVAITAEAGPAAPSSILVYRLTAGMLAALAVLAHVRRAGSPIVPPRLGTAANLLLAALLLIAAY
jgi:hypothetical protein